MDFTIGHLDRCSNVGLAARIGDIDLLERLVSNSALLDVPDNRGWLPIHEAAFGNHYQFLQRLLDRKGMQIYHFLKLDCNFLLIHQYFKLSLLKSLV